MSNQGTFDPSVPSPDEPGRDFAARQDEPTEPTRTAPRTAGDAPAPRGPTERAASMLGSANQEAKYVAERGRTELASHVGHVADALRVTSEHLHDDEPVLSSYAELLSEQIDRLAGRLEGREIDELAHDVQAFARRKPAVFIGGAALLGFAAARLLKTPSESSRGNERPTGERRRRERRREPSLGGVR